MMNNMKFKVNLFLCLTLMLIGGCMRCYFYDYDNIKVVAASCESDESEITPHVISSIPNKPIPELMVMLNGKEMHVKQSLTKNEVLDFIKRNRVQHEFESLDLDIYPDAIAKIYITLLSDKGGYIRFSFSGQTLTEWNIGTQIGKAKDFKIASPKNKKFYPMPINVLQMKKIFGKPLESKSAISIK